MEQLDLFPDEPRNKRRDFSAVIPTPSNPSTRKETTTMGTFKLPSKYMLGDYDLMEIVNRYAVIHEDGTFAGLAEQLWIAYSVDAVFYTVYKGEDECNTVTRPHIVNALRFAQSLGIKLMCVHKGARYEEALDEQEMLRDEMVPFHDYIVADESVMGMWTRVAANSRNYPDIILDSHTAGLEPTDICQYFALTTPDRPDTPARNQLEEG